MKAQFNTAYRDPLNRPMNFSFGSIEIASDRLLADAEYTIFCFSNIRTKLSFSSRMTGKLLLDD